MSFSLHSSNIRWSCFSINSQICNELQIYSYLYTDNYELLKIDGVVAIAAWITNKIATNYIQSKA